MADSLVVGSGITPDSSSVVRNQRPPGKGVADPTTCSDMCARCDSHDTYVDSVQGDYWRVICRTCGAVWLTDTLEDA